MRIERVTLGNFRVYSQLELELEPGLNVITGANGQGKTALLEAIYCLATSRSFRTSHESELVRWGESTAWVASQLRSLRATQSQLGLAWRNQRGKLRKELSLHGQRCERLADFLGVLPLALFTPEDLALVQGAPSERRRYLDLILCKLYPAAVDCLGRYQKVLAARNALLRQALTPSPAELEPWELLWAPLAAELTERRAALVRDLQPIVAELHARLVPQPVECQLIYRPQFTGGSDEFLHEVQRRRREEMRRRTCLVGPHRDELELVLDGSEARRFASQGQCRSLALALRLAQATFFQRVAGESAVVLLDDCFSELDERRQEGLLNLLSGFEQAAVTSATPLARSTAASHYVVEGGRVKRC